MSAPAKQRVLLLITTESYKASAFLEGARRLGVDVVVGTERAQALAPLNPEGNLTLPQGRTGEAVSAIRGHAEAYGLDAVLAADDEGAVLAATAAAALGFEGHEPEGVALALDKHLARDVFVYVGLHDRRSTVLPAVPAVGTDGRLVSAAGTDAFLRLLIYDHGLTFPCVLKPRRGSASHGVIRADDAGEFVRAWRRVARMIEREVGAGAGEIVVEPYIPGVEVALEGLMTHGELRTLAIFDKPDPLEGPFFEETIYVTPSRLEASIKQKLVDVTSRAAAALELRHGPIHAELRTDGENVWPLEIAPRSIGGLCSRALRFEGGATLEQVILAHTLGRGEGDLRRESQASGVMMIPVPASGALRGVTGVEAAAAVPGVSGVQITVTPGERVVAWPEGNRYLGFIFAGGSAPGEAEEALREAHRQLEFDIVTEGMAAAALDLEDEE